jgi:glutamate synthase domain-containing protein 3
MVKINANGLAYRELNELVRKTEGDIEIDACLGQRYIGAGLDGRTININGVAGNAVGAYLNGAVIKVNGNVQDAAGDTMNAGKIVVHGTAGDAVGYAMRGGQIYIKGSAGYRSGIHMKAYGEKFPVVVVGGSCGSFLGEYQAGGLIIVLGLGTKDGRAVGNFPGTGMHGGSILLRGNYADLDVPPQVKLNEASAEEMEKAAEYIKNYCDFFDTDYAALMDSPFWCMTPNSNNPYKQLYVQN